MRTLVTGATGFIGSHLIRRLVAGGDEVTAIVRRGSRLDDIETIVDDGDIDGLIAEVSRIRPRRCIHLATHFAGVHAPRDIAPLIESNISFGTRVLEACSHVEDLSFVNVGTIWQHYEARAYSPVSLYGATKQALADIARFYAEVSGTKVVNLELSDTYGRGDPRRKIVKLLMQAASNGTPIPLTEGRQLMFLLHVDDVVDALTVADRFATTDAPSFSLPPRETIDLRQLVEVIERVTDRPIDADFGAQSYRAREMMTSWQHHPPLPGWQPRVGLDHGLGEVWHELQRQGV